MKTQVNVKKLLLKATQKIGEKEIIKNTSYWPPICSGIVHQPKLPKVYKK